MIGRDKKAEFANKGTDIYLFMDYNWVSCDGSHSGSRNFLWGKSIFGKGIQNGDNEAIREWTIKAYRNTVKNMVGELNLKNCAMAVTVCGSKVCVMTELTNRRSQIKTCILPKDFYFEGYSLGNLVPYLNSGDAPYELFYKSALESKKLYPNRNAVGIVIRQSNFSYQSDREKASEYVRLCAECGMEVITIGVQDKSVLYEKPVNTDELKLLSTNRQDSILCDWEGLQKQLIKIAKDKGGPVDYGWEAVHAEDWFDKMLLIDTGCLEGNAFCLNESGKREYFGIYYESDYEYRVSREMPIQMASYEEDWERAERHFCQAAERGIPEAMLFLGRIYRVNAGKLRSDGKQEEAEKKEIQAEEWLHKAEEKKYTSDKVSTARFLGLPISEIREYVQADSEEYQSGKIKKEGKKRSSFIWGLIVIGVLIFLYFMNT